MEFHIHEQVNHAHFEIQESICTYCTYKQTDVSAYQTLSMAMKLSGDGQKLTR